MPLCVFFDSRGILQHPFWEQSRERRSDSGLATGTSQHLSARNASGHRLCVVRCDDESMAHIFALTRRNQITSRSSSYTVPKATSNNRVLFSIVLGCRSDLAGNTTFLLSGMDGCLALTPQQVPWQFDPNPIRIICD